jgi:hypothetical protein
VKHEAWVVDFSDVSGRHIKTFKKKRDAEAFEAQLKVNMANGTHTPRNGTTVADAVNSYIRRAELDGLERGTIAHYLSTTRVRIVPRLGKLKLAEPTAQRLAQFRDDPYHRWPQQRDRQEGDCNTGFHTGAGAA